MMTATKMISTTVRPHSNACLRAITSKATATRARRIHCLTTTNSRLVNEESLHNQVQIQIQAQATHSIANETMKFTQSAVSMLVLPAVVLSGNTNNPSGGAGMCHAFAQQSASVSTSGASFRRMPSTAEVTAPASSLPFVGRSAMTMRGGSATTSGTARSMSSSATAESVESAEPTLEATSPNYAKLVKKLQTITHLERAQAVLSYDQLVFMPQSNPLTAQERGAQLAALASVVHAQSTDPELLQLMDAAQKELSANDADKTRLLQLERKSFEENARVPAALATKSAELSSSAYAAWVQARTDKDFDAFRPVLQDCFETAADIAAAKLGDPDASRAALYTKMLDQFERGMSKTRIDDIFQEVQEALVPLIAKVMASETPPSTDVLHGTFPVDAQQKLSQEIVTTLGFELDRGRIDVSVHPFTNSFSPSDVRITSRFRDDEWYQGLAGTIHEGGHAMYEQNMGGGVSSNSEDNNAQSLSSGLSIDQYLSMGTHESQSLFWERHIGLSKPFWRWATPKLKSHLLDDNASDVTAEDVYGAVNAVSQSLIRVEADELTYPLHVILRYQIESDVVAGKMDVKDMPQRWNDGMKELLDITVPSDDQGCLQDVHWSALAIGYFPTYLIGAIAAAQLAHYCEAEVEDFEGCIERGEFGSIKSWLVEKVHRHGRRYTSLDEMFGQELGEALNPKYFIKYLTDKYSDLYKL